MKVKSIIDVFSFLNRYQALFYLYRMKNVLITTLIILSLASCNNTNEELKKHIINSDSVAINYFPGDGSMDTVIAVKIIRDQKDIQQLATFVSERSNNQQYSCGVDGSLHFFKMNKVIQDVDFRMNAADCMHFSFLQQGELKAGKLSNEAKEFLGSLKSK
ncbi:MAG: hypothetical protein ABIN67_19055 [Ferruginibacter sp.]